MSQHRRIVRKREALAMASEALQSDRRAMWWAFSSPTPANVRVMDRIAVVHVRGPLDHHDDGWCDNYEAVLDRVSKALTGDDVVDQIRREQYWTDRDKPLPAPSPPACVVLRIDSPGGAVSGLNETVFALRRLSQAAGIPLIAYVDELAASAAYALACACDEIVLPPSAIVGSVGVISTMYDQVAADTAMGINFATITSGARKADGHPHVPLSDDAIAAEQARVDALASQFYQLVSDARNLSPKEVKGLQAAIFMGEKAISSGLADAMMGWDELLASLSNEMASEKTLAVNTESDQSRKQESPHMSRAALSALVRSTEARIAKEKNAARKKELQAALSSYQAALAAFKKTKYKEETVEQTTEEDDGAGDEEAETDAASGGDDGGDEDDEDDGDDEEAASEESDASAALAELAQLATGRRGKRAVGALAAVLAAGKRAMSRVEVIERERRAEQKINMVRDALSARRITRNESATLQKKPLAFVKDFLSMRTKAIVNTDDDVHIPSSKTLEAASSVVLPADVMEQIELAVRCAPDGADKASLRTRLEESHKKRLAQAGAAGRY